eukprot:COSAG02_NODE_18_length_54986_cov_345.599322_46_plen_68_part_00
MIVGVIENKAICVLIVGHPGRVVRARALTIRLCRVGAGRAAESGSACAGERADAVRAGPAVEAWAVP